MSRAEMNNNLSMWIDEYKEQKDLENSVKKITKDLCDKIKTEMAKMPLKDGKAEFSTNDWTASITVKQEETINQDRLLEVVKQNLGGKLLESVVRTKEYIDEDALEKLIYNGDFDANLLVSCTETKNPVTTLRVTKKKKYEDNDYGKDL